jgi:hypothetical protein
MIGTAILLLVRQLSPIVTGLHRVMSAVTGGAGQVGVRAEMALAAFTTPSSGGWIMVGKSLS